MHGLNRVRVVSEYALSLSDDARKRVVFGDGAAEDNADCDVGGDGTKPWMGSAPIVAARKKVNAFDIVMFVACRDDLLLMLWIDPSLTLSKK